MNGQERDGRDYPAASSKKYHKSLNQALEDSFLRKTLDKFAVQYRSSREAIFSGLAEKELIREVALAKDGALSRIGELYGEFAQKAREKGLIVHRAQTAQEAREIISNIARENGAKKVIKSKSMTAEEIDLNRALEGAGLEVVETDLGEWIIQLRDEPPSHMVLPAIHLSRFQVAEEFAKLTAGEPDTDIGKLVKVARRELRAKFAEADLGVTGANFAVAASGAIGLCTNEGNARLTTNLPRIHVALIGLDKLVPTAAEALSILRVLPRNATAQPITTYVSWLTGIVDYGAAADKGKIVHAVFLDNGRLDLIKDPKCREVLRCVRCGACANVCPVFRLVGGHRMGYVYIGAIGLILTYFLHGREKAKNLINNCVGCEACKDVCAAGIDLSGIISEIRARINEEDGAPITSSLLSAVMGNRDLFHALLKYAKYAQKPAVTGSFVRHLPEIVAGSHGFRALPAIANRSFRETWPQLEAQMAPKLGQSKGPRVAVMAGCAHDFIYPEQLVEAVKLLLIKEAKVSFPTDQSCCGLPLQALGQREASLKTAKTNLRAFAAKDLDYVVSLCPSCANFMKNRYPLLFAHDPDLLEMAQNLSARVIDFSSLVKNVLKFSPDDFTPGSLKVAYHSPCHLGRGLGVHQEPRQLIALAGQYLKTPEEEVCCGFGGSYSLKFPEISAALMKRKLESIDESGAEVLVTDCPGCVLQLRGGEEQRKRAKAAAQAGGQAKAKDYAQEKSLKIQHISEFLSENIKKATK
ncbi:MAG: LUD domain-containing protein [Deltaproteobacteria bacterium]|nr:LUD domain-containing protein [Deltaproteobacteria bacterium]